MKEIGPKYPEFSDTLDFPTPQPVWMTVTREKGFVGMTVIQKKGLITVHLCSIHANCVQYIIPSFFSAELENSAISRNANSSHDAHDGLCDPVEVLRG